MAEKNGNGWTKYLVGVLVTLVLFVAIPTIASNMIANDKASRNRDIALMESDNKLREDFNAHCLQSETKMYEYAMTQEKVNGKILATLEGIGKDLDYLKRNNA